jgi:hypothetical protein
MNRLWLQLQSVSPHWPSVDVSTRCEGRLLTGVGGAGDRPSSSASVLAELCAPASDGVFPVWQ